MKLYEFKKFVFLAVVILTCYAFAAHPQTLRMQEQALQRKAHKLNKPAENESRKQRVERQLNRNRVRSELARVENRIATSRPSIYEQSSRLGQLRSSTRTKADQFVPNSSSRDFSRSNTSTHDSRNRHKGICGYAVFDSGWGKDSQS